MTHLQLEAQEKESLSKAEYDIYVQVRKFEIEAEKEVMQKKLHWVALKITSGRTLTLSGGSTWFHELSNRQAFDVSKNISCATLLCGRSRRHSVSSELPNSLCKFCAYELFPQAYRNILRNHRKSNSQTFEFEGEECTL